MIIKANRTEGRRQAGRREGEGVNGVITDYTLRASNIYIWAGCHWNRLNVVNSCWEC